MAIPRADTPIFAMDEQLGTLVTGNIAAARNRFLLRRTND
jgi:hypothetical protein